MADIELVIKISEEARVAITRMGLLRIPDEMQKEVDRAIQNGTPLDDIRKKIDKLEYLNIEDGSDGYDKYIEQYEVLKIIDKYKGERE